MAEYYSVLKKAIGSLDSNAADARRTVYDKARNALIGQLKAVDPPLTTAEISRQRLELEEAIRKVEREAASGGGAPAARPPNPPPAIPRAEPPPAPAPIPVPAEAIPEGPSPQDVFRRAIQEAEQRGSLAGGSSDRAPPQYRADASYPGAAADLRLPRADRPPALPPERETLPVIRQAEPEYRPQAEYRPQTNYDEPPRQPQPEPRLAPEYGQDWDQQRRDPPPSPRQSSAPFVDSRDRPPAFSRKRKRGYLEEDDRALYERAATARKSRLPSVLLLVLIVAVVGGLAALGWSNREKIADLMQSFGVGKATTTAAKPATTPAAPVAADSNKTPDRLPDAEAPAPPASDVRVVGPTPPDASADTTAPAPAPAPAPEPAPAPADDASAAPAVPAVAPVDAPATGDALVAQKAILYEEPLDAAAAPNTGVTAINAAVTWRFIESGANGPEIEASLQVPERGMKVRLSIHKNSDKSLPASHLIEVIVDVPPDFPGKGIKSVPRVVLKPTEEARGQPLVGAPAKVTNGFFWIALSAADQDITSNLALLKDRNWIDLPFVYESGQRAILTIEKGTPGERVFEKAMAAWIAG